MLNRGRVPAMGPVLFDRRGHEDHSSHCRLFGGKRQAGQPTRAESEDAQVTLDGPVADQHELVSFIDRSDGLVKSPG